MIDLALQNMFQLLKPTDIGISYMVERLQGYITNLGHEQIQSLRGENVSEDARTNHRHFPRLSLSLFRI